MEENQSATMAKAKHLLRKKVTIVKDAHNTYHNSYYAKLHQIIEKLDNEMGNFGLCYDQVSRDYMIYTTIYHDSGISYTTETPIINDKGNSQGYGSGQTYAMRYGLCMAFGLAPTDDDDGNASVQSKSNKPYKVEPSKYPDSNTRKPQPMTDRQKKAIEAICAKFGIENPNVTTFDAASKFISEKR